MKKIVLITLLLFISIFIFSDVIYDPNYKMIDQYQSGHLEGTEMGKSYLLKTNNFKRSYFSSLCCIVPGLIVHFKLNKYSGKNPYLNERNQNIDYIRGFDEGFKKSVNEKIQNESLKGMFFGSLSFLSITSIILLTFALLS